MAVCEYPVPVYDGHDERIDVLAVQDQLLQDVALFAGLRYHQRLDFLVQLELVVHGCVLNPKKCRSL